MYFEVLIGAVAKELRAARPEVGQRRNVLLRRQRGCLMKVKFCMRHCRSPFCGFFNNAQQAHRRFSSPKSLGNGCTTAVKDVFTRFNR
jgi:hypothetical protein